MNKNNAEMGQAVDRAWAAGFVDGEGCITVVKQAYQANKDGSQRSPTLRFKLMVVQNCWSTLKRLQTILDEKSYLNQVPVSVHHNKRLYQLQYDGFHAYEAAKKLEPFLHRKRHHMSVVHELFSDGKLGKKPGRKGWDAETLLIREKLVRRLKKMN
jgi:hypothetical protein